MPLYAVKVKIFGLPTNIFEILVTLSIIATLTIKRDSILKNIKNTPKILLLSILMIILGTLLSILGNGNFLIGLGILKSWFILPICFSLLLPINFKTKIEIESIFKSFYFSALAISLFALSYKARNILTYDGRLANIYSSPNYLAMYLSPGLFFGLYFLLKSLKENFFSKKFLFYLASLLIILISLYYTYSYGAWISVFLSILSVFLIYSRSKKLLFFNILLLTLSFVFLFSLQLNTAKFSNTFSFSERSSSASRLMIWRSALMLIKNNFVVGIGPGNFQKSYLSLQPNFPPYLEWAVPQPHNLFLAFWLQTSIFGLTAFCYLLFFTLKKLLKLIQIKKDTLLAMPLLGFFIYTIFHGLIDTPYWKNDLSFLFWVLIFTTIIITNYPREKL